RRQLHRTYAGVAYAGVGATSRHPHHPSKETGVITTDTGGETPHVDRHDPSDDPVQLLSPTGERVHHEVYSARADHLDRAALEGFYRDMALTRRFDVEATALQRQGELGLWPPCLGQE